MKKLCTYCNQVKSTKDFGNFKPFNRCRQCNAESCRRTYQRFRAQRIAGFKAYYKNNKDRFLEYYRKISSSQKMKARRALHIEMDAGRIIRQPCEVCGNLKSEAHHPDYSKPLDVRWLCRIHHAETHRRYITRLKEKGKLD